jgi:hypothetical protein
MSECATRGVILNWDFLKFRAGQDDKITVRPWSCIYGNH